jgi:hypothetical protein
LTTNHYEAPEQLSWQRLPDRQSLINHVYSSWYSVRILLESYGKLPCEPEPYLAWGELLRWISDIKAAHDLEFDILRLIPAAKQDNFKKTWVDLENSARRSLRMRTTLCPEEPPEIEWFMMLTQDGADLNYQASIEAFRAVPRGLTLRPIKACFPCLFNELRSHYQDEKTGRWSQVPRSDSKQRRPDMAQFYATQPNIESEAPNEPADTMAAP